MRVFEWNALRAGDKVLAHDFRGGELMLLAGVVTQVDAERQGHGPNQIGVVVATGEVSPIILWPARLAVHRDPRDPTESCWRCEAMASRARQLSPSDVDEVASGV